MQIVIDIPSEMYDWYDNGFPDEDDAEKLWQIVKNGIPLPKGHGRLIDADEIQFENNEFDTYSDYSRAFDAIDGAETIIEADKVESEVEE